MNTTTDIIMAVDLSRISQDMREIQLSLSAIIELTSFLNISSNNISLGLLTFSTSANLRVPLGSIANPTDFKRASQSVQPESSPSNTTSALDVLTLQHGFSTAHGSRLDSRKMAVIISTGNWTDLPEVTKKVQSLQESGITVLFVAVGENADFAMFDSVTADKHNIYWIETKQMFRVLKSVISKAKFVTC